jgi:hypothetical protein
MGGQFMCSGCSGEYGGEFDDSGEPAPDVDEDYRLAWNGGASREPGNQRNTRNKRAFEGETTNQYPHGESVAWPGDPTAADFCEILVSGKRILEIRVIEADGGNIQQLPTIKAAERPAALRHSTAGSAKYYRTRPTNPESGNVGLRGLRSPWAAIATGEFRRWLRWARKALGTSPAKGF